MRAFIHIISAFLRLVKRFWFKVQMHATDDMRDEILGRVRFFLSKVEDRSIPCSHVFMLSDSSVLHVQSDSNGVHLTRSIQGGVNGGLYDALLRHARDNPSVISQ